jgi:peptidylprolyl isomerase
LPVRKKAITFATVENKKPITIMNKKDVYIKENESYLKRLREQPDIRQLPGGTLYKVLASGTSPLQPQARSVVTCHYKGSLINGRVFDSSYTRGYPEAFRVSDLISGFQQALLSMHVGDHWEVYIPASEGYGKRAADDIPGGSTLIFDIELIGVN